ncbi:HAD-IA family hydrolase [Oscillatoria sp. FACHB-1407]|uniref:HAD-IA family hydrolase n=1 Tax=Oscillatoria sp. FACHB-1407 TaxID=2692847 RepID=UPI0016870FB4|nr:HAD-IA family hydrolase [Oscillatoria sp. FACHB-1407]MBD2464150.1 HAD-IA family hydrolase [Oscillatoria sp. FACHB-1407]
MPDYKPITHIIYDLDGLLLDTEFIHAQVNQAIASQYGKVFDTSIQSKVIGRMAADSARIIIDLLELPLTVEEFVTQKNALIYDRYPLARPMAGAMELTQHFHQHGIPQAIASSSTQRPFQAKTTHHREWMSLFQCVILSDDPASPRGKPAPDCFLVAAERLGTTPDQCLVFEDSIAGVTAAKRAGMSVVAVPAPYVDRGLLQEADEIFTSLAEFQPEPWHLPSKHFMPSAL